MSASVESVAVYLGEVGQKRWKAGDHDCCTFVCGWVSACGKPDPMADIRGAYHDNAGWQKIAKDEGGFLRACARRFKRAGLTVTKEIRAGDIAVVVAPTSDGKRQLTAALCVSSEDVCVVTSDLGLLITKRDRLPIVKAWTING